jgi:Arm DNA-binding domain
MPVYGITCKNAKPKDRPYKLADSEGLHLLVQPSGEKYFRLQYRFLGTEKTLALGVYPETSLVQAREDTKRGRKLLRAGVARQPIGKRSNKL